MDRRAFLQASGLVGVTAVATTVGTSVGGQEDYGTVRVPDDEGSIQAGVEAASRGDLVLVAPGTYEESVQVTTPGVTLRGTDRNEVVLDGGFEREHGVHVEADGVAVENLTVRHFTGNAVYWTAVEGFRGSYLTAYNNGYYGIYAYRSRNGRFEYSYASGHPDAGFYLGRNRPYEAVISHVVAEHNGVGYSGTSTGADLAIRDSVWRHNRAGIVPNTLDEVDPPERASTVVGNVVYANDNPDAPVMEQMAPTFGTGILLWGGNDNLVEDNVVGDHEQFGIVAEPNVAEPSGNVVRGNVVRASGVADLALGSPTGDDNAFASNQFASSLPQDVENDASDGAESVSEVFAEQRRRFENDEMPSGDWQEQPEPGPQPIMRDPEAPPRPAEKSASWSEGDGSGEVPGPIAGNRSRSSR
jgi:hypothetical protein